MQLTQAKSQVLWQYRTDKGLTLRQVSKKGLIALGYLSELERGHKQPSDEVLKMLLDALDVSLSDYLREVADLVE